MRLNKSPPRGCHIEKPLPQVGPEDQSPRRIWRVGIAGRRAQLTPSHSDWYPARMERYRPAAVWLTMAFSTLALAGCGLVFQRRTQSISITTDPPAAEVTLSRESVLETVVAPATVAVQRSRDSLTVCAVKPKFQQQCQVLPFRSNRLLVTFDSIPAALGLLVDRIFGTWPGSYPDSVYLALLEEPKNEPWIAHYRLSVSSLTRPDGQKARPEERPGPNGEVIYLYSDPDFQMSITPKVDTIDLRIRNVSGRVAKLTWDEAVFVDFDDTANRMGHGEPTTIETERSQVPSVIPPDKILQETVFPMNRVYRGVETRAETSSACMRQCQQTAYTCMAAYNCSGYRSRNQYPSNYAFLQAIANNIEAGLCERRCLDQRHACFGTCTELKQVDTGLRHLPIVPNTIRPCTEKEEAFTERAKRQDPTHYSIFLPFSIAGSARQYMLNLATQFDSFEEYKYCPQQETDF